MGTMAKRAAIKRGLIFPSIKSGSGNVRERLEVPPSAPRGVKKPGGSPSAADRSLRFRMPPIGQARGDASSVHPLRCRKSNKSSWFRART
jgi:hypothetical protein